MNTFILIMILCGASYESGWTTVVAEFNSREACEFAKTTIQNSIKGESPLMQIKAQSCFAKGLK